MTCPSLNWLRQMWSTQPHKTVDFPKTNSSRYVDTIHLGHSNLWQLHYTYGLGITHTHTGKRYPDSLNYNLSWCSELARVGLALAPSVADTSLTTRALIHHLIISTGYKSCLPKSDMCTHENIHAEKAHAACIIICMYTPACLYICVLYILTTMNIQHPNT